MEKKTKIYLAIVTATALGAASIANLRGTTLKDITSLFNPQPTAAEAFFEKEDEKSREGTSFSYRFTGYGQERHRDHYIELDSTESRTINLSGNTYDPQGIQELTVTEGQKVVYSAKVAPIGEFRKEGYQDNFPNLTADAIVLAERYTGEQGKIVQDFEVSRNERIEFRLNLNPGDYNNGTTTITSLVRDNNGDTTRDSFDIIREN